MRCTKVANCAPEVVLPRGGGLVIAVDATDVYWGNGVSIFRKPKPVERVRVDPVWCQMSIGAERVEPDASEAGRPNRGPTVRSKSLARPARRVLELAEADGLHQLLELGPVDLLGDLREPMVRRDLDRGPLRPRK